MIFGVTGGNAREAVSGSASTRQSNIACCKRSWTDAETMTKKTS